MRAILSLALARLYRGPTRWLLIVAGVAVATLLPMSAAATAASTSTKALAHGLAALPPGEQSLIVSYPNLAMEPDRLTGMDTQVRTQLAKLTRHPARAQMLFREMGDTAGGSFFLGAADDLASGVEVTSGRLPAECTPQHCEVILIGQTPPKMPDGLGVEIVGTGVRTDPLLLTGTFEPKRDIPLLLADGVAKASAIDALTAFQRQYGWVAPLDVERASADVPAYLDASRQAGDDLSRYSVGLHLTAPDEVLSGEHDRAQRSTRRFDLLSGAATALLVGFAVIGAIGARRDHRAVVALVRRRGAPARRLFTLTAVTAVIPVLVGTVLGVLLGLAVFGTTALSGTAVAQIAVTTVLAAVLLGAALSWAPEHPWRAVDAVVVAGIVIAAVALARGAVTVQAIGQRTDPLLVALPIIAIVCGGLLAGRLFPLVAPLGVRIARRLPGAAGLPVRLGLSGAVRRPLRAVATVAFLAAATGIVLFAGGYRATLEQGAVDQATFAVPLDVSVRSGQNLRRPLDVADEADYTQLAPGVLTAKVVRTTAGIRVNAAETKAAEVVGVTPDALTRIPAWDRVTGGDDAAHSAQLLTAAPPVRGWTVPAGTKNLTFDTQGPLDNLKITAWLRDAGGRDFAVELTRSGRQLSGDLAKATTTEAKLFALNIAETADYGQRRQHHTGEGGLDVPVLSGHLTVRGLGNTFETDYELATGRMVALIGATPETELPVIVDPVTATAASGGRLQFSVQGSAPVTGRIVQVLPRFPATGERFVVADVRALADALDAREPGTGSVSELWLSSSDPNALRQNLAKSPYDQLSVRSRAQVQDQLATDPLAVGAASLLWTGALVALGVAAVALVLLVIAERRDDAAELYAWESDGLTPGALRGLLFARATAVVAVAVPCGVLLGLLLTRLTTALVLVTAVGSTPRPPLALAASPLQLAAVLGAGVGLGLLCAGLVAWRSFRTPLPVRPEAL
ncbi:MAG: hypothetical protein HOV78_19225 [Hamadaea sp.]|nr:hypothetical protein [Hamadaea sp.]